MIILGVDPGIATTGYCFLSKSGNKLEAIEIGAIITSPKDEPHTRLLQIYNEIDRLIDLHKPDSIATERLFFSKNEKTALIVGRTIGVVLLLAAQHGLPWTEYTPMQVKQGVVGYGGAEKHQVQFMVAKLLKLNKLPKPDDAADAAAVAICHAYMYRNPVKQ